MSLIDAGLWCEIGGGAFADQPALFLDRDGVIVVDTNYLGRVEDLRMIGGSAAAVARCNKLGIPVVLVTNQSGIARGYYGWDGFQAVQAALSAELAQAGGHLDAVLACAYHEDGREPLRMANHPWRKPNPGMVVTAAQRMNLDLSRSWIIGDQVHDLATGRAAGLAGGTLVAANDPERQKARSLAQDRFSVETASNLGDAVATLIKQRRLGAFE
jgi:D-glycero-D-manno-heptose 1,7-bisphosphate phosphatase